MIILEFDLPGISMALCLLRFCYELCESTLAKYIDEGPSSLIQDCGLSYFLEIKHFIIWEIRGFYMACHIYMNISL